MASKTKKELQADVDYLLTQVSHCVADIAKETRARKAGDAQIKRLEARLDRMSRRMGRLEKDGE